MALDLTGQKVSVTYDRLVQKVNDSYYTGLGILIPIVNTTILNNTLGNYIDDSSLNTSYFKWNGGFLEPSIASSDITKAYVDGSLNLKTDFTYSVKQDASISLKTDKTYVDGSLNLIKATYIPDVSLNQNYFKWNGGFLEPSIASSDVTKAYVDGSLNLKTDFTYSVKQDASISLKTDKTYVDGSLNLKTDFTYSVKQDGSINLKTDKTYVDASLAFRDTSINNLQTYVDSSLNIKTNFTYSTKQDTSISLKTNFTYSTKQDASISLKTDFTYSTKQDASIETKQVTLVSGNNIKTINTISLLGSGDLSLLINWRNAFNVTNSYILNDAVSYLGSSYICILDSSGFLPTNNTYWDLLAQMGNPGVSGLTGALTTPFTLQTSVTVTHNFGGYPAVEVYDDNGYKFIPYSVQLDPSDNTNKIIVTFDTSTSGNIICTLGGVSTTVVTKSGDYTITSNDNLILVTAAATITLPATAGLQGKRFYIKHIANSGIPVVVNTTGGKTIDGESSKTIIAKYTTLEVFTDANQWYIL
jgi:hypothetical protein